MASHPGSLLPRLERLLDRPDSASSSTPLDGKATRAARWPFARDWAGKR